MTYRLLAVTLFIGVLLTCLVPEYIDQVIGCGLSAPSVRGPDGTGREQIVTAVCNASLPFIENEGHITSGDVRFYTRTLAGTVFITGNGEIVYALPEIQGRKLTGQCLIRECFTGSAGDGPTGKKRAPAKVNYFSGNESSGWKGSLKTFSEVSLSEIYENIELKLRARAANVEKCFYIKPGGSVEHITIKVRGARKLSVDDRGELVAETGPGALSLTKPVAFQNIHGKREYVDVSYTLNGDTYGFTVGRYDRGRVLVIDPLISSTFLGGTGNDIIQAVTLTGGGDAYVAGLTLSTDFPATNGAFDEEPGGKLDAFVFKLGSGFQTLDYCTFLGGSDHDSAYALALDASGNVYVAGATGSTDFPMTGEAYNTKLDGYRDAFVVKLDSSLQNLLSSTYLGGSDSDFANAMSLDDDGNVYVAGETYSWDFPMTGEAYDTVLTAPHSSFVTKLDGDLKNILASTYLDGSTRDEIICLALGSSPEVCVAGWTVSPDFPTTDGAFSRTYNGNGDIFVSKLDGNLQNLVASTFLGGKGQEMYSRSLKPLSMTLDGEGNVYLAGSTYSTDFPMTAEAFSSDASGFSSVFISKLDNYLQTLLASTYLGGSGHDYAFSVALDSDTNIYVTGETYSGDFPMTGEAYNPEYSTSGDAFVARFDNRLKDITASTFLGSAGLDYASFVLLHDSGDVYVMGETHSTGFPMSGEAYDTAYNGGSDLFISKLDNNLSSGETVETAAAEPFTTVSIDKPDHPGSPATATVLAAWTPGSAARTPGPAGFYSPRRRMSPRRRSVTFTPPRELVDEGYRLVKRDVAHLGAGCLVEWEELSPAGYTCLVSFPRVQPSPVPSEKAQAAGAVTGASANTLTDISAYAVRLVMARGYALPGPPDAPVPAGPRAGRLEISGGGKINFQWTGGGGVFRFLIVDTETGECVFKRQTAGQEFALDPGCLRDGSTYWWGVAQADNHLIFSRYTQSRFTFRCSAGDKHSSCCVSADGYRFNDIPCRLCRGTGAIPGSRDSDTGCPRCRGEGHITEYERSPDALGKTPAADTPEKHTVIFE